MLLPLVYRRGVAGCGEGQRAVENIFGLFEVGWRCPQQPLRLRRCLDGRRVVAGKEARLQLADPIPALDKRQIRIFRKVALDPSLIKLLIVERAESRRQAPQRPDQPELADDGVNDKPEPRFLREREATLGFAFHLGKRIAGREKVGVQFVAAIGGVSEVAGFVCSLERAAHQIAASPDMFGPGQNDIAKIHIDSGLEPRQSASFDQVIAELTEAVCRLIVAKAGARDDAKVGIGDARSVAVAAVEAEIDRSAGDQGKQVRIRIECRRPDLGQNLQRRQRCRVAHQRQLDQSLDRAAPELRPDPLVFALRLLFRRMRRPVDAEMPEVVETDGNSTAAPIKGRVQIYAEARHGSSFHRIRGAP
jgi:hypothetical protein